MTECSTTSELEAVAVVGGTGPQGSGLALRFALAGHPVILGSRSAERAQEKAKEMQDAGVANVSGATNAQACASASLVVVSVPYEGHNDLIVGLAAHLENKVVVTCVNPMSFDKCGPIGLLGGHHSAAEATAELLPYSAVVGAFHHLAAASLNDPSVDLSGHTVMVAADDESAADRVAALAAAVTGQLGVCVGPLRLSRHLEPLTAVLISTNRRYRTHSGVALVGVPSGPPQRR